MTDVYQDATLIILADGAKDSQGGLFNTVCVRRRESPVAIQSASMAGPGRLYARSANFDNQQHNAVHAILGMDAAKGSQNPLRRRGWTLQEWLLSPRMVHFTSSEVLWECNMHQRCECQLVTEPTSANIEHVRNPQLSKRHHYD